MKSKISHLKTQLNIAKYGLYSEQDVSHILFVRASAQGPVMCGPKEEA